MPRLFGGRASCPQDVDAGEEITAQTYGPLTPDLDEALFLAKRLVAMARQIFNQRMSYLEQ